MVEFQYFGCSRSTVNGTIVDARHAPKEIQKEAVRKGPIAYIPADQTNESDDE